MGTNVRLLEEGGGEISPYPAAPMSIDGFVQRLGVENSVY